MAGARRGKVFSRIGAVNPVRSAHDLSHRVLTTTDMGILYPITSLYAMPGDFFKISNELVIRLQPCFAPVLHQISAYIHWFFVPFRILWNLWEEYRTTGRDGKAASRLPLPLLTTTSISSGLNPNAPSYMNRNSVIQALYGISSETVMQDGGNPSGLYLDAGSGSSPLDFPLRAYNKIYNDYYRDENFIDEYALAHISETDIPNRRGFHYRAWEKDYFTSALPDLLRGQAPAFPIADLGSDPLTFLGPTAGYGTSGGSLVGMVPGQPADPQAVNLYPMSSSVPGVSQSGDPFKAWLNQNSISTSQAALFDVTDVRDAFAVQKYLERNMRAGVRYTEWLRARFGLSPRDERLDRPEYIGGSKHPVIISEVLQTSQSMTTGGPSGQGSPQANMAGHGLTADQGFIGKYTVKEDGIIMAILSVMPRAMYMQGLDRQWIKRSQYEFPLPEFTHVSERAIEQVEIYPQYVAGSPSAAKALNTRIFGYIGMYDEFRYIRSRFHGDFILTSSQSNLSYWHLGRYFASSVELNRSFIECNPQSTKRIFNVQTTHGLMVSFGASIYAVRPIPSIADPGLVDHF